MTHPLPALAAVLALPLLGLAMHPAALHASAGPTAAAAASLPTNLCASCHASAQVSDRAADSLGAHDLVAARTYLADRPRG